MKHRTIKKEGWWNWDGSVNRQPHWSAHATTVDDFGDLVHLHRCAICRLWKLAVRENFHVLGYFPTGHVKRWAPYCRPCENARRSEKLHALPEAERKAIYRKVYEAILADPARQEAKREVNRQAMRRWRKTPGYREARRRYFVRLREDPERTRRHLETARMGNRLRREKRNGERIVVLEIPRAAGDHGHGSTVPSAPLYRAVAEHDFPEDMTYIERAASLGISDKTLREWTNGTERKTVRAELADRVLINLDLLWFEVWEKPVNGHERGSARDVLAYIEQAEGYVAASLAFTGELAE